MKEPDTKASETQTNTRLIEAARALAPRLAELADEIERARSLPAELTRELAEAGFFKMLIAHKLGGLETDPLTAAHVTETLSEASGAVGWVVTIAAGTAFWATASMTEAVAREIFTPIDDVIMVGTLPATGKAVKTAGGYRLTGRWAFGSGCQQASWFASGARLFEGNEPILDEQGRPAWAVFLTPARECTILDTWYVTGLRGTGSHDYTIDEVFVPERYRFSLVLRPTRRVERRHGYLAVVVPLLAVVCLGIARAAVDELKQVLQGKRGPAPNNPSAEDLEKHGTLASSEVLVGSARAYLYTALEDVWTTVIAGEPVSMELRGRLRGACTNAVQAAVQAVDIAYAAAGGTAIYTSCRLERHFRDIHTAAAHRQVRPATMAEAGGFLLGIEPLTTFF